MRPMNHGEIRNEASTAARAVDKNVRINKLEIIILSNYTIDNMHAHTHVHTSVGSADGSK